MRSFRGSDKIMERPQRENFAERIRPFALTGKEILL
jgi:hypothetical protein